MTPSHLQRHCTRTRSRLRVLIRQRSFTTRSAQPLRHCEYNDRICIFTFFSLQCLTQCVRRTVISTWYRMHFCTNCVGLCHCSPRVVVPAGRFPAASAVASGAHAQTQQVQQQQQLLQQQQQLQQQQLQQQQYQQQQPKYFSFVEGVSVIPRGQKIQGTVSPKQQQQQRPVSPPQQQQQQQQRSVSPPHMPHSDASLDESPAVVRRSLRATSDAPLWSRRDWSVHPPAVVVASTSMGRASPTQPAVTSIQQQQKQLVQRQHLLQQQQQQQQSLLYPPPTATDTLATAGPLHRWSSQGSTPTAAAAAAAAASANNRNGLLQLQSGRSSPVAAMYGSPHARKLSGPAAITATAMPPHLRSGNRPVSPPSPTRQPLSAMTPPSATLHFQQQQQQFQAGLQSGQLLQQLPQQQQFQVGLQSGQLLQQQPVQQPQSTQGQLQPHHPLSINSPRIISLQSYHGGGGGGGSAMQGHVRVDPSATPPLVGGFSAPVGVFPTVVRSPPPVSPRQAAAATAHAMQQQAQQHQQQHYHPALGVMIPQGGFDSAPRNSGSGGGQLLKVQLGVPALLAPTSNSNSANKLIEPFLVQRGRALSVPHR